jgi:hypothetical protein
MDILKWALRLQSEKAGLKYRTVTGYDIKALIISTINFILTVYLLQNIKLKFTHLIKLHIKICMYI